MPLRLPLVVLAALALLLAACGQDDDAGTADLTDADSTDEQAADGPDDPGEPGDDELDGLDDEAEDPADDELEDLDELDGMDDDVGQDLDADTEQSVAIDPPEGWREASEEDMGEAGAMGGAEVYLNDAACDEDFCANLNAIVTPAPVDDVEEYHELSQQEIEELLEAEITDEQEVEVDGSPGYQLEYRSDDQQGELHYLQRYAVVDGEAIVVTFTATPELYDEWRDDGEAMLDSIAVVAAD